MELRRLGRDVDHHRLLDPWCVGCNATRSSQRASRIFLNPINVGQSQGKADSIRDDDHEIAFQTATANPQGESWLRVPQAF